MLKNGISFVLVLTLWALPVLAQDEVEWQNLLNEMKKCTSDKSLCETGFRDACEARGNWTTMAMLRCEGQIFRYWDDLLDWTYNRVITAAKDQDAALLNQLQSSQSAFNTYRDMRCGTYGYYQGTIWRVVGVSCAVTMTQERIADLEEAVIGGDLMLPKTTEWHKDTTVVIDLDCNGTAETLIAGVESHFIDRYAVLAQSYNKGQFVDAPLHEFPINSTLQYALCAAPISLTKVTSSSSTCPVLRIDDGQC
ncbi:MAG: DUF1311 domain-containing protein, partial [Alphaproteobacteria bacterium]|nr:DUF1311 domain-containing protein [Alphaproteobacteria bacterium]